MYVYLSYLSLYNQYTYCIFTKYLLFIFVTIVVITYLRVKKKCYDFITLLRTTINRRCNVVGDCKNDSCKRKKGF